MDMQDVYRAFLRDQGFPMPRFILTVGEDGKSRVQTPKNFFFGKRIEVFMRLMKELDPKVVYSILEWDRRYVEITVPKGLVDRTASQILKYLEIFYYQRSLVGQRWRQFKNAALWKDSATME